MKKIGSINQDAKGVKYLNIEQFLVLVNSANILEDDITHLITKDEGTCISGECLQISVLPPKKRKPIMATFYCEKWTQRDQPKFFCKLLSLLEKKHPELEGMIYYNQGTMN